MKSFFDWHDKNSDKPDNQVLEFAKLMKFKFPDFSQTMQSDPVTAIGSFLNLFATNPQLMEALSNSDLPEEQRNILLFKAMQENPEDSKEILKFFIGNGTIKL